MKQLDLDFKGIKFLEKDIIELNSLCLEKGIILDYMFMKKEDKHLNPYENHKEIAVASMLKIEKMYYNRVINNIISSPFSSEKEIIEAKKGNISYYFKYEIYEEKMNAEKIMCSRFWEEKGYYEKCNPDGTEYGYRVHGYKSAFFEPIIPINISIEEQEKMFKSINNKYLSPFNDENLEIYSWNDDWSNYFDSGKEYWGTFFWTIYNKEKDIFIVIGASTTD